MTTVGTEFTMKNTVTAIVPAAGVGKRFGGGTNKPLVNLCDKPLIIWTLQTLDALSEIKEIIPVVKEEDMAYAVELFEQHSMPKI